MWLELCADSSGIMLCVDLGKVDPPPYIGVVKIRFIKALEAVGQFFADFPHTMPMRASQYLGHNFCLLAKICYPEV